MSTSSTLKQAAGFLWTLTPHVIALLVIFPTWVTWDQYTHYNISFVQMFFTDMHALHNLMPYAHWSLKGEIGLWVLNPGFVSGTIVGVAQVRRPGEIWKGLIPMGVCLGCSGIVILYWGAFHWIPMFLVPAYLGSALGFGAWTGMKSLTRKLLVREIA